MSLVDRCDSCCELVTRCECASSAIARARLDNDVSHVGSLVATTSRGPQAVRFNPNARAFEAFAFNECGTGLLDPLEATSLDGALAETTERWRFDRGHRIGIRELGNDVDQLHVYAVRRTSTPLSFRNCYDNPVASTPAEYKKRLEHICTINLRVISGEHVELIGNPSLDDRRLKDHARRQQQRPYQAERNAA